MSSGHYSTAAVAASLRHFLLGRSLGMLLGLGLLLLLVRVVGSADYGTYVTLLSLLEIVQIGSSCGLILIAQRYLPELRAINSNAQLRRLTTTLLAARALTLVVAIALLFPFATHLASFLGIENGAGVVKIYLVVIFFEGFARFAEVCQDSLLRQRHSQSAMLVRTGLRLSMLAAIAWFGGNPVALLTWIYIDMCAAGVGAVYGAFTLFRFVKLLPSSPKDVDVQPTPIGGRRVRQYVVPAFMAQLLYTSWGVDAVKLVAARLVGASQIAAFGFAAAFSAMMQRYMPVFLLMNLIRPLFVAARVGDDYKIRLPFMANLVFKLNAFALAPIAVFVATSPTPLANLLSAGRLPDAGVYLAFFMGVLLLQALRGVLSMVSQAMELGRATLLGTLLGTLGLAVGVGASTELGLRGLCLGLAMSEVLWCVSLVLTLRRYGLAMRLDSGALIRMLVCAATGAALAVGLDAMLNLTAPMLSLAFKLVVCVLAYLLLCRIFRPFDDAERKVINGILKRNVFCW